MGWMKNFYEKIKPFAGLILLGIVAYIGVTSYMGTRRANEYRRTLDRIDELIVSLSGTVGDIVRGLSDLESGINNFGSDLGELEKSVRRLEEISLDIGDASTESAITSDRARRVARELAERRQENNAE